MPRVRHSLQEVQNKYDTGEDRSQLENLIRAFRGIQELDSKDPNSFFVLGGYHGEPFRGKGQTDPDWWGGYCNHGNVLFPTWHRAYLLRFEDALRSIPKCEDVTLPFWDETFARGTPTPIPSILTAPEFDLDGKKYNPLYSYKLQEALVEEVQGSNERYSKPVGYQTVRYPLSGLVGTEQDREDTELHNSAYTNQAEQTQILNGNVANWLDGTVQITPDPTDPTTRQPDTYSVYSRYRLCLEAPNYTVFSNNTSATQWIKDQGSADPHYVVSLESPHNAIHLAVGGFYQAGVYNADPIIGANGDMGDNETAGFDPVFFLHHCFIDYVFWQWQKEHGVTAAGSLAIIPGYSGTVSVEGLPDIPPGTSLTMGTPLYPFKQASGAWYTSADVTDVEAQLGYSYASGSLDPVRSEPFLGAPNTAPITGFKRTHGINRAEFPGSFVIRTFAQVAGRERIEIGRDAVLSRWNVQGCANCRDKLDVESLVPLDEVLLNAIRGVDKSAKIEYSAEIQTHHVGGLGGVPFAGPKPIVGDL